MKSKILELLLTNNYISGQEISDSLGISRTAVWKHIKSLKKDGYIIEAQYGKGYQLIKLSELSTPEKIKLGLNTKKFAKKIYHFKEVESTNEVAKELGEKGLQEGTMVIAEKQTRGKGRLGRQWQSPSTGLWFSLILRPDIPPRDAPQLSLLAAAALQQTLHQELDIEAKIKWPNDILVNNKKICGILTEMKGEMDRLNYIVMGVGINVNQLEKDFAPELLEQAISIRMLKGETVDKVNILRKYLEKLESLYFDFIKNGFEKTRYICLNYSSTINQIVTIYNGEKEIIGKAVDIGKDGSLILDIDGKLISFYGGEITTKRR